MPVSEINSSGALRSIVVLPTPVTWHSEAPASFYALWPQQPSYVFNLQ